MALTKISSGVVKSGTALTNLGYTPVNKAGDTMTGSLSTVGFSNTGNFVNTNGQIRALMSGGGEWAVLGTVWADSGNTYLHIKTSLPRDSYKMVGFKVRGFQPYSSFGEGYFGCYTYGPNTTTQPYGVVAGNMGNHAVASTMYYSSDNYVVLSCNWPTTYNGLLVEYIAAGQSYGNYTGVTILSYTKSASQTGAY